MTGLDDIADTAAALRDAGWRSGAMSWRGDRPVKNGRWYLAAPGALAKVGWGDVSFADLRAAIDVVVDQILLVLPENPPGGQHLPFDEHGPEEWCWYDRPDDPPGPTVGSVIDGARYVILDGELRIVDHHGQANRLGYLWVQRGHRYTRAGRVLSTGNERVHAIDPGDLARRVVPVVGGPAVRSVNWGDWQHRYG